MIWWLYTFSMIDIVLSQNLKLLNQPHAMTDVYGIAAFVVMLEPFLQHCYIQCNEHWLIMLVYLTNLKHKTV